MKAVVVENYDSIDNIRLKDVAMPELSAGQVRVRIRGCKRRLRRWPEGARACIRPRIRCPLRRERNSPASSMRRRPISPDLRRVRRHGHGAIGRAGGIHHVPWPRSRRCRGHRARGRGLVPRQLPHLALCAERARRVACGEYLLVLGAAGGVGIAAVQLGKLLGAPSSPRLDRGKTKFCRSLRRRRNVDCSHPTGEQAQGPAVSSRRDLRSRWRRGLAAGLPLDRLERASSGGRLCRRQHPCTAVQSAAAERGALLGVHLAEIPAASRKRTGAVQLFTWLTERKLEPVVGQVFALDYFRDAFRTMRRAALGTCRQIG